MEAVAAEQLDRLLGDESIPIAHRALWSVLWEGELRLDDLLSVDVRDVDLAAQTVTVDYPAKANGPITAPLGDRGAAFLRQAIGGRTEGPLFAGDGDKPLSHAGVIGWARSAGVPIHGFRLGGQLARAGSES